MSRQQKTGCNTNCRLCASTTQKLLRCCLAWLGESCLAQNLWRRGLWFRVWKYLVFGCTNTYFSGLRGVSHRFQVGHNYQNFTHLHGGDFMCYLWYLQKFSSLPRPYPMRQGMLTTKKEWPFERQEFQACFGQPGGFEASTPLLKGDWGGGGEKNQCWHKKACYLLLEIHTDVRL